MGPPQVPISTPETTASGVAKLEALVGKPTKAPVEEFIGEAATPPNRGPLIGAAEPELIRSVAQTKAAQPKTVATTSGVAAGHTSGPTPSPKKIVPGSVRATKAKGRTVPGVAKGHTTGPTPSPPQSIAGKHGGRRGLGAPATQTDMEALQKALQKPEIPPFLQSAKPTTNALEHPAIQQVLLDPSLSEDKKLEMILRGLGAIA
jgi:hypothetical protein